MNFLFGIEKGSILNVFFPVQRFGGEMSTRWRVNNFMPSFVVVLNVFAEAEACCFM